MVAELLTVTAPLIWAVMAELVGQKSGVLNIGIEGVMLVACLAAALAAPVVGPWWAVAVAVVAGLAVNLLFAAAVITGADQVVAGTGVVLLGTGLTGVVFRYLQTTQTTGALVPTLPWGPLELGGLCLVAAVLWLLRRTRVGLLLRACGENPDALASAGVSPIRLRLLVLGCAGALTGVAGAALVLRASGTFVEGMTAGRGFLALALVMLGRWRPVPAAVAALLLGAAITLQFHIQGLGVSVSHNLLLALPYALTLLVLALMPKDRLGGPAALAKPYRRQG